MRSETIAIVLVLAALPLGAQSGGPKAVPATGVIDAPGSYVLSGALTDRAAGISITANDVWLDMNGESIAGPGGNRGTGIHIRNVSGVRVTNGVISDFGFGVVVEGSRSVHISNLQIRGRGLAVANPPPETGVMIVQSRNVIVASNAFYNVGLGIFVRGGQSWGNRIVDNTVTAGTNGAIGICYNPAPGDPAGPRGDLIQGNLITGYPVGLQFSEVSIRNLIKDNTIVFSGTAIEDRSLLNSDMSNAKLLLQ